MGNHYLLSYFSVGVLISEKNPKLKAHSLKLISVSSDQTGRLFFGSVTLVWALWRLNQVSYVLLCSFLNVVLIESSLLCISMSFGSLPANEEIVKCLY